MKTHPLPLVVLAVSVELARRSGVDAQRGQGAAVGQLRMAPVGRISARVTVQGRPAGQGVDVYIPGTSYVAKTATDGSFVISDVPAGTHHLAASSAGLGTAQVGPVRVLPAETTATPDIALPSSPPPATGENLGRRVQSREQQVQALRAAVDRLRMVVEQHPPQPGLPPPPRPPAASPPPAGPDSPTRGRKCDPNVPRYAQPGCIE